MIVRRYPGGRRYDFQNGQVARSAWKEKLKPLEKLRTARNVEACLCVCIVFYRRFLITRLVRTLRLNTFIGVVAMVPHTPYPEGTVFFVVEKPGLDVAHMGGNDEELMEE